MWAILITLRTTNYLTKSLVLGIRNPGESRGSSDNVDIATALGFFREFEGKTLLLKIPHTLDTEPGGSELGLT